MQALHDVTAADKAAYDAARAYADAHWLYEPDDPARAKAARKAAWNAYCLAAEADKEVLNQIEALRDAGDRAAAEALVPKYHDLLDAEAAAWKKFCACDTAAARANR